MVDETKSRRRRRPPPLPEERREEPTTDEEFPAIRSGSDVVDTLDEGGGAIAREMARRGLAVAEETDEEDTGELQAPLVFGAPDVPSLDDTGQTFVGGAGAAPADLGGKTEILPLPGQEPQAPAAIPILTIDTAEGVRDVEIVRERFVIGRSPDIDVVLPDQLVSRQHAAIERRPDGWWVVDLNSGNGTFLNDQRIQHEEQLIDADVLHIGDAIITFNDPSSAAPADSVPALGSTQMLPAADRTGVTLNPAHQPKHRKRKKLLVILGVVATLLLALGFVKKLTTPPTPTGPTPEQIAAMELEKRVSQAEIDFERVKGMVKEEKWIEAKPLIDEISATLQEVGGNELVDQYKTTIDRESGAATLLAEAQTKLGAEDPEGAMVTLTQFPAESVQKPTADELKRRVEEALHEKRLTSARQALDAKDYDGAIALADELLQTNPGDEAATGLKRNAEEAKARANKPKGPKTPVKPPKPPKPPKATTLLVGDALEQYRKGDLAKALAMASASGVSADGVSTLRKFESSYTRGLEMAKKPGQAPQAVKFLLAALAQDKKLGGGKGTPPEKLRDALGKAQFFIGVDAHTRKKYPEAYQAFVKSLQYKPDLKQAKDRLKTMEGEARKMFETAYILKASAPEKATNMCTTVIKMVPKENKYYGKCKKLLAGMGGGSDEGGEGEGDGF